MRVIGRNGSLLMILVDIGIDQHKTLPRTRHPGRVIEWGDRSNSVLQAPNVWVHSKEHSCKVQVDEMWQRALYPRVQETSYNTTKVHSISISRMCRANSNPSRKKKRRKKQGKKKGMKKKEERGKEESMDKERTGQRKKKMVKEAAKKSFIKH